MFGFFAKQLFLRMFFIDTYSSFYFGSVGHVVPLLNGPCQYAITTQVFMHFLHINVYPNFVSTCIRRSASLTVKGILAACSFSVENEQYCVSVFKACY